MIWLFVLLWVCGWLAGLSLRALDRGEVVVVDLFVMFTLSWMGALIAISDATARRQIWKGPVSEKNYRPARTSYHFHPEPTVRRKRW